MGGPDQNDLDLDRVAAAIEKAAQDEADAAEKLRKALEEE